uniref:Uncharacterized protein n=1 Tax=Hyaloperonospora arabidopsidis (strain Emoy2) TaxID=559515 RepID=M4C0E7_HYAAE
MKADGDKIPLLIKVSQATARNRRRAIPLFLLSRADRQQIAVLLMRLTCLLTDDWTLAQTGNSGIRDLRWLCRFHRRDQL